MTKHRFHGTTNKSNKTGIALNNPQTYKVYFAYMCVDYDVVIFVWILFVWISPYVQKIVLQEFHPTTNMIEEGLAFLHSSKLVSSSS